MQRNKLHTALGLVASGKRALQSGSQYNKYFSLGSVQNNEVVLLDDGNVTDTITQMKKIVSATRAQTKAIAPTLRGATVTDTARNVWNFLYNHVQYTKDNPLREQLRTPARTWADRSRGVDCDCYAIFISSVLTNLGVPHFFRIAAYGQDFQHVYVVAKDKGREVIIDPVLNSFNTEQPYTKKQDFNMKVTMLNGPYALGACAPKAATAQPQANQTPVTFKPFEFESDKYTAQVQQADLQTTQPAQPAQTTTEALQASVATPDGTKVLWGLGLAALALTLVSAFKKKQSLSGTNRAGWLSVAQL